MKIVQLKAENVKRLKAVEIKPGDGVTVIGGKNGAGKTSVLDSILYVLAGAKSLPSKPLRDGAKSGKVVLKLDGDPDRGLLPMTVTRTFTKSGGQLTITTEDGFKAPSPQTILDDLRARFIDPLAFTRESPAKQQELLRELAGLDFTDQDQVAGAKYDERTIVNRDVKRMESILAGMIVDPDAPDEEVSVAELTAKLEQSHDKNVENDRVRRAVEDLQRQTAQARDAEENARDTIFQLERKLDAAKEALASCEEVHQAATTRTLAAATQADKLEYVDTAPIRQQIANAEDINRRVREKLSRKATADALVNRRQDADDLTLAIDAIAEAKQKAIASAEWPILGLDDDSMTFNGLPFDQASSAEQLRVSVAMGFAMNPALPVLLIRDGSLLDDDSLTLMRELAEANSGQIFIERVGEGEECSVVIEDGSIKGDIQT